MTDDIEAAYSSIRVSYLMNICELYFSSVLPIIQCIFCLLIVVKNALSLC